MDADGDSPSSLHSFTGPQVPQGEGTSIARAFLDGNHTLISIMARINPSPDWFVGVDSFQLCVEGNWVDTVTVELDPLDGGTDNGFTFTAANWPTQPQGIAYRITSRYPAHPAGSFYYPNLPRLPPIATLTFTKGDFWEKGWEKLSNTLGTCFSLLCFWSLWLRSMMTFV
ncbi:hypothetical protein K0M31_006480 [Melipona bicolor]|uniref:Spondin domain-containing protein n=1 Tax=Melipona bicolor TaxID=60889 RepID=A0AA40KLS9_9HYME|nr:hypothetical protein K0M31_006480 [Melipona bicolor]